MRLGAPFFLSGAGAVICTENFEPCERRTVKIFVDGFYGCDTEDVNVEDLLKLLALVHAEGSHEERD